MTLIGSNFNLNNIEQLLGQSGFDGQIKLGNGGTIDIGSFLNGSTQYGDLASNDYVAKGNAIQSLIGNALSTILNCIASAETASAKKESKDAEKASADLNKNVEKSRQDLEKNIEVISNAVSDETDIVKESITTLDEQNKVMQEKQEEINKILEEIQKQQALLISANPDERAGILTTIQGLSNQLKDATAFIVDIQTNVADASKNVENSVTMIEELKGNSVQIQEDGKMLIQEQLMAGVQEIQKNFQSKIKAKTNEATANAAEKAAQSSSNIPFGLGAGAAAQLYRVSTDQNMAAEIRTNSSSFNLQQLLMGIGKINENGGLLNLFNTSIGSALNEHSGFVGDWNTALESTITSIGSFTNEEGIVTVNEELQESLKSDLGDLGYTVTEDGDVEKATELPLDDEENEDENNSLNNNDFANLETVKTITKFKKLDFAQK